jgi:hypothetical protein
LSIEDWHRKHGLWIDDGTPPRQRPIDALLEIMVWPRGSPWDREQNFRDNRAAYDRGSLCARFVFGELQLAASVRKRSGKRGCLASKAKSRETMTLPIGNLISAVR